MVSITLIKIVCQRNCDLSKTCQRNCLRGDVYEDFLSSRKSDFFSVKEIVHMYTQANSSLAAKYYIS